MVSKTISLRTELQMLFKTLTNGVYYEQAPDDAAYPYLVYELSELFSNDGKTVFQLEVNLLDYGEDSFAIETLADDIQTALNKYYRISGIIEFTVYLGLRQTIKEEDKKIIRRRLLFEIQLHELKGE